jgi:hypothetical protein
MSHYSEYGSLNSATLVIRFLPFGVIGFLVISRGSHGSDQMLIFWRWAVADPPDRVLLQSLPVILDQTYNELLVLFPTKKGGKRRGKVS